MIINVIIQLQMSENELVLMELLSVFAVTCISFYITALVYILGSAEALSLNIHSY